MITIINWFRPRRNVEVHWMTADGSWATPIKGGSFFKHQGRIREGLILKALDKESKPKDSSIRISDLPDNHSINISYNTADKTWTLGKGVESLIACQNNVNVEIGP